MAKFQVSKLHAIPTALCLELAVKEESPQLTAHSFTHSAIIDSETISKKRAFYKLPWPWCLWQQYNITNNTCHFFQFCSNDAISLFIWSFICSLLGYLSLNPGPQKQEEMSSALLICILNRFLFELPFFFLLLQFKHLFTCLVLLFIFLIVFHSHWKTCFINTKFLFIDF